MTTTKFRPLKDNVLIKANEAETTTKSGIVLPDTGKEKPVQGTIMAIGCGKCVEGKKQELVVKTGDKVLFAKYAGTGIELDGEKFLVMREEEIMGVLE